MATSNPLGSPIIRDLTPKPSEQSDQTAAGYSISARKRSTKGFGEIAEPLRGKSRENTSA
jgi:hypothetical protein